jgi:hypothetical protein
MSFVAMVLGFFAFVGFVSGIIGFFIPSIFKDKKTGVIPKRSFALKVIFGSFLLSILSMLLMPNSDNPQTDTSVKEESVKKDEPTKDESTQTVKDLSKRIGSIEEKGRSIDIKFKAQDSWSGKSEVSMASHEMDEILEKIVKNYPDKYDEVRFILQTKLVDKYGNSSEGETIWFPFDMKEVSKVNFKNITNWDLLNNFTTDKIQTTPVGRTMLKEYCTDEDNLKYAQKFCIKALLTK